MGRKPVATMRVSGRKMFTLTAEFHVDLSDMIWHIVHQMEFFDAEIPLTRRQAFDLVIKDLEKLYRVGDWDDFPDETVNNIDITVRRLFPEL